MSLFDQVKNIFGGKKSQKMDVSARFQIEKQAVSGTMSKFQVAREIQTGRTLGLKILDSEKTAHFNSRFKGLKKPPEGEIALKIDHKYVVNTIEHGTTTKNEYYILMEYIDGPGLDLLVQNQNEKLIKNRLKFIRQMGHALQAVHEAGFIHRDVCPRNFICDKTVNNLKLIDFGLTIPDEPPYRQPGNRTGTPQYMAPEIVRRRQTDLRVDVFAYGVTMYRMLSFEHPWGSTDTTGIGALAHDSRPPDDILKHRPDLNPDLASAIHRCIEADPGKRPKSIKHFLSLIKNVEVEVG